MRVSKICERIFTVWTDVLKVVYVFIPMLEVDKKLIDTSGWLNYAFLHSEEFTSR